MDSPVVSEDAMDLSDTIPLDLSVKSNNPCSKESPFGEAKIDVLESLNELANLQNRFITTTDRQNYVDQLQKVTNGPTLIPSETSQSTTNFQKVPPTSPYWPGDWSSLYHNMPLQYQLAASQLLWNSGYAAAAATLKNPTVSSNKASPVSFRTDIQDKSTDRRQSNKLRKFFDSNLSTATAPPEAFGISMRGNQKYSAYYQRPFLVPLAPSKRPETSSKRFVNDQYNSSSEEKDKNANSVRTASRETAFQCSCGEEFENLYIFTLHMKESNHSPKCARNERDIPKLVRGQDMWINSEIEQTREILRCMRCNQSFRTLPDLTMHMIKTSHYSEIVYSDSGRCVFVNSEDNNNNASKKVAEKRIEPCDNISASGKISVSDKELAKFSECNIPKKMPRLKPEVPLSEKLNISKLVEQVVKATIPSKIIESDTANVLITSDNCDNLNQTLVTEADSATIDSVTDCNSDISLSDSQTLNKKMPTLTSVISQIESFVEKNLPRNSSSSSIKPAITDTFSVKSTEFEKKKKERNSSDNLPYVAPDNGSRPTENPLSSLQKLVETTHKTTNKEPDPLSPESVKNSNKYLVTSSCEPESANSVASPFHPNSPTVIMVNPTYIYQPAYSGLSQLYSYPWYQSLPMYGAGMGINLSVSDDEASPNTIVEGKVDISPAESPKCEEGIINSLISNHQEPKLMNSLNISGNGESAITPSKMNINCNNNSTGGNMISKKAKCNYCGKPFANKGQVRLHISKGKCPSLLQSCHSNELPSLMTNPFSYVPLDYVDRSSEERLRMLYSLTKHMVTKESV